MLNDWLAPTGLAALEKIGWPECVELGVQYTLERQFALYRWVHKHDGCSAWSGNLGDHAALCIIRDWAREKLLAAGIFVRPVGMASRMFCVIDHINGLVLTENGGFDLTYKATDFANYDAALIAAINHKERN